MTNGALTNTRRRAKGTADKLARSIETPVTPPSMKWFGSRKLARPKPATRVPATSESALRRCRSTPILLSPSKRQQRLPVLSGDEHSQGGAQSQEEPPLYPHHRPLEARLQ